MSEYIYKVLLVYPEADIPGVRAFIDEFIDPGQGENWINLSLSASGQAPATHGWCCFHATKEHAELWLARFANRLGAPAPVGLTDLPPADQLAWISQAKVALLQASGIYFDVAFGGESPSPDAALQALSLQRIEEGAA